MLLSSIIARIRLVTIRNGGCRMVHTYSILRYKEATLYSTTAPESGMHALTLGATQTSVSKTTQTPVASLLHAQEANFRIIPWG